MLINSRAFTRTNRIALVLGFLLLGINIWVIPSQAVPVLPSSFYGTVQVDDANVPAGSLVRALIDDRVFAETTTIMYEGQSVYSMYVPGDDSETPEVDGGREGDVIFFEIHGVTAEQTGTWHSGTNVELNLIVSTSAHLKYTPTSSSFEYQPEITKTVPPTKRIISTQTQDDYSTNPIATSTGLPQIPEESNTLLITPGQIEQSMFETAVFEEEPVLENSSAEHQLLQTDNTVAGTPRPTPAENSSEGIFSFLSPFVLLIGIGAAAAIIGIAIWFRMKGS